jgi:hypothetical protein
MEIKSLKINIKSYFINTCLLSQIYLLWNFGFIINQLFVKFK